jgi:hypothetical protein
VLSTRRDLLPLDVADELAKLQDRVPPFPVPTGRDRHRRAGLHASRIDEMFDQLRAEPVASASIAQVHFATCEPPRRARGGGQGAAPGHAEVIDATIWACCARWPRGRAPVGRRQAAEAARGGGRVRQATCTTSSTWCARPPTPPSCGATWPGLDLVLIPEMHWDYCTRRLVMERMHGVPISQVDRLREAGVDIKKLARDGVTIFFTQVFRDGFFHADMHPGNIQVSVAPATFGRYIALDFGIVGTLTERQGVPGAEFHRLLPARLQARGRAAHRERLGAAVAPGWTRWSRRHPRRLRAALRPAAEGHLAGPGADAPVPDLAALQCRDPAAAGAAAEDAAQHRGAGPPARPRPGPVGHRQALPRDAG